MSSEDILKEADATMEAAEEVSPAEEQEEAKEAETETVEEAEATEETEAGDGPEVAEPYDREEFDLPDTTEEISADDELEDEDGNVIPPQPRPAQADFKISKKGRINAAPVDIRNSLYRGETIVPVGRNLSVLTEDQKCREEYSELHQSAVTKNSQNVRNVLILTDTVFQSDYNDDFDMAFVYLYHGHFKVSIPVNWLVDEEFLNTVARDQRLPAYKEMEGPGKKTFLTFIANLFIGAEIDYVVHDLDEMGRVAVGNRVRAMEVKRRRSFFISQGRSNRAMMNEGDLVEARVVGVTRRVLYIEYGGFQEILTPVDISYTRIADLTEKYYTGQKITTRIVSLRRNRRDNYAIECKSSVKEASIDNRKEIINGLKIGSNVAGWVVQIDATRAYFVNMGSQADIDIMCRISGEFPNPPGVGDRVLVRITRIEQETSRVYGHILRKL